MISAQRIPLADGRWHFQHGPIDCIVFAEGDAAAVDAALERAWRRFVGLLDELMREMAVLRLDLSTAKGASVQGRVAARMVRACFPHATGGRFITAMAAVAGSVADELIGFFHHPQIVRVSVNNGGDIALYLNADRAAVDDGDSEGDSDAAFEIGLVGNVDAALADATRIDARFRIDATSPVRGIATSGWRGRSFSFGIADSVTVLARSAAEADAAATVIANAVDLDDPRIERARANEMRDDSDLGERLVVVGVPVFSLRQIGVALGAGARQAEADIAAGRVLAAVLHLQGRFRVCGMPDPRTAGVGAAPAIEPPIAAPGSTWPGATLAQEAGVGHSAGAAVAQGTDDEGSTPSPTRIPT